MTPHIVLISGSGSVRSHTASLLEHLAAQFEKKGVQTTLWDLERKPLPFLDPEFHESPDQPNATVREFIATVKNADGVILGTPIYHGSFSGRLKNALDTLDGDAFRLKPVALVSNGGGAGNTQACEQLRSIVRTLYGYALQTQIATGEDDYQGRNNILINPSIKKRCKRLVDEMVFFLGMLDSHKNVA